MHDRYYNAARAAEERRLARSSVNVEARAIHLTMAAKYEARCEPEPKRSLVVEHAAQEETPAPSKSVQGTDPEMSSDEHRIRMPFTIFRSAADEIAHKVASDEAAHSPIVEERRDDEGGHMSSTSGSVRHVPGSALPFIATLGHDQCDATDHPFATMREAEPFIRRNTPVPANALATTYDWAPLDPRSASAELESTNDEETILTSLKAIDERLRQMSAADAASVLAGSMVQAGLRKHERLQLIAEMERILDELEGEVGDKPRASYP